MHRITATLMIVILLFSFLSGCRPVEAPDEQLPVSATAPPTAAAAAQGGDLLKVALLFGVKGDPFYMEMVRGAQAEADKLGVALTADGPERWDPALQRPILESMVVGGNAAICIAANDPGALTDPLKQAADAGIDIFSVDTFIGDGDYVSGPVTFPLSYIGSDNVEGGRMACQALIDAIGGSGKLYIQKVLHGIVTLDEREQGCRAAIEATNGAVVLVGVDASNGDADTATQQTKTLLERAPDLSGIFLTDLHSPKGVWKAIREAGLQDSITVAMFDADAETIDALRDGTVDIVIAQHPYEMGQKCVESAAVAAASDSAGIPKRLATGYTVLTRDNLDTEEAQQAQYFAQ